MWVAIPVKFVIVVFRILTAFMFVVCVDTLGKAIACVGNLVKVLMFVIILDPGAWTLNQDHGSRILDPGSSIQGPCMNVVHAGPGPGRAQGLARVQAWAWPSPDLSGPVYEYFA